MAKNTVRLRFTWNPLSGGHNNRSLRIVMRRSVRRNARDVPRVSRLAWLSQVAVEQQSRCKDQLCGESEDGRDLSDQRVRLQNHRAGAVLRSARREVRAGLEGSARASRHRPALGRDHP